MTPGEIDAVNALLVRTMEAHGEFEETILHGVYDKDWARWYAAYAVAQGIGELIGRSVSTDRLAELLASSNVEFEQADPRPADPWAAYTARRIAAEL